MVAMNGRKRQMRAPYRKRKHRICQFTYMSRNREEIEKTLSLNNSENNQSPLTER